jgi:hypothetical protein
VWCKEIQLGLGFSLVRLSPWLVPHFHMLHSVSISLIRGFMFIPILNPLGFSDVSILCNGTVACWKKYDQKR